jgi:ribonucleoside-triphosphate reductase
MKLAPNFPTDYEEFIYTSRYSRWLSEEKRRETWPETVARYLDFVEENLLKVNEYKLAPKLKEELRNAILNFEVMPSMRALMTAGPALARDNTASYNCAYLPIDDPKAFDEAMFVLLCGTGVGFSVEPQYVNKLPEVPHELYPSETIVVVRDSKEGWAKAYRQLLALLWSGEIPKIDISRVRPAGSRLKTFGGRASGPQPLVDLFDFTINIFKHAVGSKLTCLQAHDIVCKIAEIVVVGGVRRSALISLSALSDDQLRHAKSGTWYLPEQNPQRALANNSAVYNSRPDMETFVREWLSLIESKSGERGLFSRDAAKRQAAKNGRRDAEKEFGCNPCSEILLQNYQFCNLTECVIREEDTVDTLKKKVELASILGTFQSTLIHFPYLRKVWYNNTESERLLGVSLTGIMDNAITNNSSKDKLEDVLETLRDHSVAVNKKYAKAIGIPQSVACTTVKPSGTVSQLCASASGIHTRHSLYYLRTVRADLKDPLTKFMQDKGIPSEPCVMKPDSTVVFTFPQKAPKNAVCRDDRSALEQLDLWLIYQRHWCEHKPSVTISVRDEEWLEVGAWVYKHFDEVSGISFLPHSDHVYKQAPYQECDKETYTASAKALPKKIDWSEMANYETEDNTVSSQTLACTGSSCELVDISD